MLLGGREMQVIRTVLAKEKEVRAGREGRRTRKWWSSKRQRFSWEGKAVAVQRANSAP